jgi:plastocyanin
MKWSVLFAILAVMLLFGCAKSAETTPTSTTGGQPAVNEVQTPSEPALPVPTTETINLGDSAADPATLTVAAGSTIVFKNTGDKVKIVWVKAIEFSEKSPRLVSGDSWELTIPNAGEYEFLDIIIGKVKGTISVQ